MRGSDPWLCAALALWAGVAQAQAVQTGSGQTGSAPVRVVSMNLCTDQMAMLLAAPGQLVSVSYISRDPLSSAMPDAARAYPVNHGLAEEIFLLQPDLVLAGTWSSPETVAMLRRLGIEVVQFEAGRSIEEVGGLILDIGAVLGRDAAAASMLAQFDADLARLTAQAGPDGPGGATGAGPRAALYSANGYTSGSASLAGNVLALAGFRNIADEEALAGRWFLPLEELILAQPDLVLTGDVYPGASNAEELLRHPALRDLMGDRAARGAADADWVCGTPHVLRALARLIDIRAGVAP